MIDATPDVSVIVPARNEAGVIGPLLDALLRQELPLDRFEVIVVDDRSSDETSRIAGGKGEDFLHFKLIRADRVSGGLEGKQNALDTGIRASRGRIIVQTDADCLPPPFFLSTYLRAFENDPALDFAFGRTGMLPSQRLLSRVQSADLRTLLFIAAMTAKAGFPLSAMGNNIAYRKKRYEELGGYSALGASRVEDYQLVTAFRKTGQRIGFLNTPAPLNLTRPVESWTAFYFQRLRWARGVLVLNPLMNLLALTTLALSLIAPVSVIGFLVSLSPVWGVLLCAKLAIDGLMYLAACLYFHEPGKYWEFVVWEPYALLSPAAYALGMGITRHRRWR